MPAPFFVFTQPGMAAASPPAPKQLGNFCATRPSCGRLLLPESWAPCTKYQCTARQEGAELRLHRQH